MAGYLFTPKQEAQRDASGLTKEVNEKIGPVAQFANRKKKRFAIGNSDLQGAIARRMGVKK